MLRVLTPSRAAASRSIVRLTCRPRCCWSESTSVMTDWSWRQRFQQLGSPGVEIGQRIGLQGELVLRIALAAADPDVLHRLHEEVGAGHLGELGPQAGDHLVGRQLALAERLQGGEHEARVGREAAGEAGHAGDIRILADDLHELPELPAHRLEGDALVGADAGDDAAGVLLREEALGDRHVEIDVEDHRRQEDEHRQPADGAAPGRGCGRRSPAARRSRARWRGRTGPGGRSLCGRST